MLLHGLGDGMHDGIHNEAMAEAGLPKFAS
jgi:hypothetical protein